MQEYENYIFQEKSGWLDFLGAYFSKTMRETRRAEADRRIPMPPQRDKDKLFEDMAAFMFGVGGGIGHGALAIGDKTGPRDPLGETGPRDPLGETGPRDPLGEFGPRDPMGGSCGCGSIKNFPHDIRPRNQRLKGSPKEDKGPTLLNFSIRK